MAEENIISIAVDVWEKKLALYMAATGKNMREALYEEWPLLIRKVMDFTPPFKSGGQKGATDQAVGRAAVASNIYRTMRPFNPAAKTKQMERILERRDVAAFNVIAARSKNPLMSGLTAIAFSENEHTRQRNRRGRVTGTYRKKVVLGSDVGLLKAYVAKVQGQVGYAKSGWWPALQLVGGEAPGYVTDKGTGGGEVIDNHADENPSITAINHTSWAVRQDEGDRIKSDAYASRAQAIHNKVLTKIRLAKQEAGLSAA